jgi:hypothetical protein
MSARPLSALALKLRRELEARGLTTSPQCPACGDQHDPKDFARSGLCRSCDAERQAMSEQWAEEQAEVIYDAVYGDLELRSEP